MPSTILCDECDTVLQLDQAIKCPFNGDKAYVCEGCCKECGYNEDGDCTYSV